MRAPSAAKKPKASEQPAGTATAAEKPAAVVETPGTTPIGPSCGEIGFVTVELPIDSVPRNRYFAEHVDFRLGARERRTIGRLLSALQTPVPPAYRLPFVPNRPGKLISSSADVLKYVLEKVAIAAGIE